jgi:ubiquinone/menaquinone biosynthesis C-methylase UbiE
MAKWPKIVPPLTPEQKAIADDFMHYWHEVLPKKYSSVDRFGHQFVAGAAPAEFLRTLEIGAGIGEHLAYERLSPEQLRNYYGLDIRDNMLETLERNYPGVKALAGDCQQRQPFPDGYFDRIIAIHVLEHLPNLPAAVRELRRLIHPERGVLQVVIPCEGSLAYSLARKISAQRIFEKRYKQPYRWFISREHLNVPREIVEELEPYFAISGKRYFPFPAPFETCNLVIAFTAHPKRQPVNALPDLAEMALDK